MPKQSLVKTEFKNVLTVGGDNDHLLAKLLYAINNATEIDIAVSFVKQSGLQLILPAIQDAIEHQLDAESPLRLRIITSDYLGITCPIALRELIALEGEGVELKVYTEKSRSFHMKSYIFVRTDKANSFYHGAAFIGSNNISESALKSGHEWCLRFDYKEPDDSFEAEQFKLIRQEFDNIFTHPYSVTLTDDWINDYIKRRKKPNLQSVSADWIDDEEYLPNSAQVEALQALASTRAKDFVSGLVVLATGMGKTWLSAFDAKQMQAKRVLFVAHREEILSQALNTFAKLWPEKTSGFYNAKNKNVDKDMLFASVQTLGKQSHLSKFDIKHFDYIVVDEFHHASAKTYRNIINHFSSKFLLGLTATPERTDQADILSLCSDNLVFERNLVDGINSKLLVPFHYYGIWDEFVDYQAIPWRNGKFDPKSLDAEFATKKRANHIFKHWQQKQQSRTLAFCVSKSHADYMADEFNAKFNTQGFKAVSVHSESTVKRNEALSMLDKGEISVIFSVDLFNEGTDLPSIDTVLMLRPTESIIIFLQQLGRGLRLSDTKKQLVVVDFIGNHQSFGKNIEAVVSGSSSGGGNRGGKPELPDDCYINYDPKLVDFWNTLKRTFSKSADEFVELMGRLGHRPTATEFYKAKYDLNKAVKQHGSWFDLVAEQTNDFDIARILKDHQVFLLHAVQQTRMTKSFKGILLKAFILLDGFRVPPTLELLAQKSHKVLSSYPEIKVLDLGSTEVNLVATDKKWLTYWNKNPVNFSCKADKNTNISWFRIEDDKFIANFDVEDNDIEQLTECVNELVDFQLSRYVDTKQKSQEEKSKPETPAQQTVREVANESIAANLVQLPYFPNLKIACGHFKEGTEEEAELLHIDLHNVDPQRHFLARASGNSMNGGKNPIEDGDLLLLERFTPVSAGSITGVTVAIERQGVACDNEYLLRVVEKRSGQYWLKANNPDYETIQATEDMVTFARFKQVILI
ncbi:DEAD/DEAH box helicase [Parashewanella curva]|uniref:DEAD/DEAH box helicase n=1 Tax=Parashewanella curva TaxID=2338552 RepID=A0A3L8PX94_9GAMM|nr:DEAD/DEAH box helicase family protein [Parashewanella curva]RLV60026.1 DEAD/DEAH box helicase [Parashewanella curva]